MVDDQLVDLITQPLSTLTFMTKPHEFINHLIVYQLVNRYCLTSAELWTEPCLAYAASTSSVIQETSPGCGRSDYHSCHKHDLSKKTWDHITSLGCFLVLAAARCWFSYWYPHPQAYQCPSRTLVALPRHLMVATRLCSPPNWLNSLPTKIQHGMPDENHANTIT